MAQAPKLNVVKENPPDAEKDEGKSLADLLAEEMDEVVVPATASLPTDAGPKRTQRTKPIPDLSGTAPVWALIGSGDSGKTTIARTLGGKQLESAPESLDRTILLASDPGARLLVEFFAQVMQPPGRNIAQVVEWQRKVFGALPSARGKGKFLGGYFDLGADAIAFGELIASGPTLPDQLRQGAVSLIGAYVLTPAVDDVAQLAEHQRLGVKWPASLLILNLGRADSPASFETIRRTPAYQRALEEGAVELWWPRLAPQDLALWIESRRFLFHEARDGIVPEGNKNPPIPGVYRPVVRRYLEAVNEELAPLEGKGFLPWLA
ncbi:conserved protein of unknown function (plasmid) [Rhodovastum atsumiense]|uniref:Uncharacterized protein n=1 Tax=Rhodovastum atsumiense TaxID=504468 RepID=A0A5M6IUS6_9PROT|nr:hypothetical protein [Rhodovastum atsumiense]KAA5611617.1 hypothetical protein F1189_13730 [Rhodovastum atsumiense]CAH2606296.1 conserved protein of unknown function [Rhodovastum atsumiense]